ncbi:MAG: aminotransferase class I/II-fold pyridoxal phosphate-dependent enzyme, partial [Lachnospiraceae bacterium]|nr:aminotransferase class I/II-fold pyridoxal phosphate-dependent enzyme [Lachnospiraceae bacterium]
AKNACLLINGSTCGILAAIFALCQKNDRVIVCPNSHKSVFHGLELREAEPVFVRYEDDSGESADNKPEAPAPDRCDDKPNRNDNKTEASIYQVSEESVIRAIRENPKASALILTTPDYAGYMLPLSRIIKEAHSFGIKVLVDGAHGAHLGIRHQNGVKTVSPVLEGADIVVTSLHKMLPALTQTALLLASDGVIDECRRFLNYFETSSPSYVLMGAAAACLRFLQNKGDEAFLQHERELNAFYESVTGLSNLHIAREEDRDPDHIIIRGAEGVWLAKELRKGYDIETEMADGAFVLALSSISDTREGFKRLSDAIRKLDGQAAEHPPDNETLRIRTLRHKLVCSMPKAMSHREKAAVTDCIGRVAADYIMIYPPGIPIILPGERISRDAVSIIMDAKNAGRSTPGLGDQVWVTYSV